MFSRQQRDTGDEVKQASGNGSENAEYAVEFIAGVDAAIGRGATDADRTYLRLRRSDGTSVYLYVDTGTTVLCSTTKP